MIIGFLGKGGSGKSTLSHLFTKYLLSEKKSVLAIDSDHNMDLLHNLGVEINSVPHFGTDGSIFMVENFGEKGVNDKAKFISNLFRQSALPEFSLSPKDKFTEKYSKKVSDNLHVMSSGPHNDIILHGNRCSHSLTTPLKVYLPLLKLSENEAVVVDMIASSDAAATGIPTGFSFAIVSVEPTVHSIKSAKQIIDHLSFFKVPHGYVINKCIDKQKDTEKVKEILESDPIAVFDFDIHLSNPENHKPENHINELEKIKNHISNFISRNGDQRKERSCEKMNRNKEFSHKVEKNHNS